MIFSAAKELTRLFFRYFFNCEFGLEALSFFVRVLVDYGVLKIYYSHSYLIGNTFIPI